MYLQRQDLVDDPLMHALRVARSYNDSVSRYLSDLITNEVNDVEDAQNALKLKIMNSASNRLIFYKLINPDLNVHDIYTTDIKVNEI